MPLYMSHTMKLYDEYEDKEVVIIVPSRGADSRLERSMAVDIMLKIIGNYKIERAAEREEKTPENFRKIVRRDLYKNIKKVTPGVIITYPSGLEQEEEIDIGGYEDMSTSDKDLV